MQDNIEQDLSGYLQSLNAEREEEKQAAAQQRHLATQQREADINSLTNIFTKAGNTNG
ncbi:hypothetical protein [Corynebacterium casei]|uniref:hypothetical protein n=1 Tax=Corynebacterium casei TaxID=160386 RepID=UPI003FD6933E